jgi:DNA repair protein RecN (Recombination protein N)
VKVRAGEEAELDAEANRLAHAEELAGLAESLHGDLYAGEEAIAARLAAVRKTLEHIARIDGTLAQWRDTVENALYGLQELGREMGDYAAAVAHDPARLDELRRRQDVLFRLKRKYGPELVDVLATAESTRAELAAMENAGLDRAALEREIQSLEQDLAQRAGKLTAARTKAVRRLDAAG